MMLRDPFDFQSSFREMEQLRREMNRLIDSWGSGTQLRTPSNYPAMNVWANEDGVIVTAELPGIETEDLDISVRDNVLTLSGHRAPEDVGEDVTYHRRERGTGSFRRAFRLPFQVDPDAVEARYASGVLWLTLPRAEEDKPRKITVQSG
jgi:HSP20 family protein